VSFRQYDSLPAFLVCQLKFIGESFMNMQEIRALAKSHKIDPAGLSKIDIIHKLQRDEGNFDCYATAYDGVCDQLNCRWRNDCLETSRK
jgi:hypothetical protein